MDPLDVSRYHRRRSDIKIPIGKTSGAKNKVWKFPDPKVSCCAFSYSLHPGHMSRDDKRKGRMCVIHQTPIGSLISFINSNLCAKPPLLSGRHQVLVQFN